MKAGNGAKFRRSRGLCCFPHPAVLVFLSSSSLSFLLLPFFGSLLPTYVLLSLSTNPLPMLVPPEIDPRISLGSPYVHPGLGCRLRNCWPCAHDPWRYAALVPRLATARHRPRTGIVICYSRRSEVHKPHNFKLASYFHCASRFHHIDHLLTLRVPLADLLAGIWTIAGSRSCVTLPSALSPTRHSATRATAVAVVAVAAAVTAATTATTSVARLQVVLHKGKGVLAVYPSVGLVPLLVTAIAAMRVGGIAIGLDFLAGWAVKSRRPRVKLESGIRWDTTEVGHTYPAGLAGSNAIRQTINPHRVSHEDSSLDHANGRGGKLHGFIIEALVRIAPAAECNIHDLSSLQSRLLAHAATAFEQRRW